MVLAVLMVHGVQMFQVDLFGTAYQLVPNAHPYSILTVGQHYGDQGVSFDYRVVHVAQRAELVFLPFIRLIYSF